MSLEPVANEVDDVEKQQIRVKQHSWISMIQSRIISQNELNQIDAEEKNDTNLAITSGRTESDPLCQSKHGSLFFFGRIWENPISATLIQVQQNIEQQVKTLHQTQPHEVHFRIKVFLKYLLLRLLFSIIGPLILVYGSYNQEWLSFMTNFRVFGFNKPVVFNYVRWVSNYVLIFSFCYYIYNNGIRKIFYEITFAILVFITENVTYAIKFAFFHPSKLQLLEKYSLCVIGDSCEQSINPLNWAKQFSCMIDKELEQSMKRLQIEPTSFFMYFMVAPNPERLKRIRVACQLKFEKDVLLKIEEQGGDCLLMAKEIINNFNNNCKFAFSIQVSFMISILRVSIYVILMKFRHDQVKDLYIIILICCFQFCYFFFIMILMMFTYRDLRRKVFSMTQLSHLISAEKVEAYQESKLFPTLNLMCIVSLNSWFNLRSVMLDYGLQYTRRSSFMLSFIMIINTLMMVVMILLFYFQVTTLTALIQTTIDFGIIASLSIALVLQGARINAHWCVHRGLLRKNLFLIQQLSYQLFKSQDRDFKPSDPVFAAFQKILEKATNQSVINDDQFLNYSLFCIQSIQNVFDDLGHQEKSQPYTVMGIAMTYELLLQVSASVLGLIGTAGLNLALQLTQ